MDRYYIGESYYSIVAAYDCDYNGILRYCRLADYYRSENKIVEAEYNYEPIYFNTKRQKDWYKAILVKWEQDDNTGKPYLVHNDLSEKVYEVVYLDNEFDVNDYNEIIVRERLLNGFKVSRQVNDEFLLIVGKKNNLFVTLLCNKKKFKKREFEVGELNDYLYIDKTDGDLENQIASLDLFLIEEDSIITIDNFLDNQYSYRTNIVERFFYNKLNLPDKKHKFRVRNVDDYFITFCTKYFKAIKGELSLSRKERAKFLEVLKSIESAKEYMRLFESKIGQGLDEIYDAFMLNSGKVIDILMKDDEMGEILFQALLENQEYHDKCLEIVKEEWENSNDFIDRKKSKEQEINKLNLSLTDINLKIKQADEKLETIEKEHEILFKECEKLVKKKNKTHEEIEQSLSEYKTSLVSVIDQTIPLEFINAKGNQGSSVVKGYLYDKFEVYEENIIIETDDVDYFEAFDCYVDNLSLYYTKQKSEELAASVFSTIANYKAAIVDESVGEIIANSLAMIIDGKKADKYSIYSTEVNFDEFMQSISKNNNTVIYIDGILNLYNETIFKQLIKNFKSKIFIFGIDEENIRTISKGIWKFASYIDVSEDYIGYQKGTFSCLIYDVETLRKELADCSKLDKKNFNRLRKEHILKELDLINLELLFGTYTNLLNNNKMSLFIINQIILNSTLSVEKLVDKLLDLSNEELVSRSLIANEIED